MTIEEKKTAVLTALESDTPLTIGQVAAACPFGATIAGDTLRELAEERRIVADLGRPRRYSLPAVESPATVTPPTDRERTEALFAEMNAALAAEPGDVMLLEAPSADRITNADRARLVDGLTIRKELGLDVTASTCAVIDALDALKAKAPQWETADTRDVKTICVALGVNTLTEAVGKVGELQRDIKAKRSQNAASAEAYFEIEREGLERAERDGDRIDALRVEFAALATHFAERISR